MKITRRHALQGTGAAALGLAGLNFDFTRASAQGTNVKRGGTLNFAISAETPHYDSHGSDTYATLHFAAPFYSTLLRFNLDKFPEVQGDLADSWTAAPDLMTYTFKLHPGVKFQYSGRWLRAITWPAIKSKCVEKNECVFAGRREKGLREKNQCIQD